MILNRLRIRSIILFLCAFLGTMISATIALPADHTREIKKAIPFESGGVISVSTVNGSIEINTWDRAEVAVTAVIDAEELDNAEEALPLFDLQLNKSGRQLTIELKEPDIESSGIKGLIQSLMSGFSKDYGLSFEINAPRETDIRAETVSGSVELQDLHGDLRGSTVNGNVEIRNTSGRVKLEAVNGSLSLLQHRGSVDAQTVNGQMIIEIRAMETQDHVSLETVNGSITLYLQPDIKTDIDIETISGGIKTDMPLMVRRKEGNDLRATLNGGGASIEIEAINGSIRVEPLK